MTGTKKGVSGVSAPVVLVCWVVVQRGGHLLLSYQGSFLNSSMDMGWQGPRKRVFNLFAIILAFKHSLASKELLQLRCKLGRSRCYGLMQASKLGPVECLAKGLKTAEGRIRGGGARRWGLHDTVSTDVNVMQPEFTAASGFNIYLWISGVQSK
eukprot:1146974-Pelagomonas_calceolata.AAC.1